MTTATTRPRQSTAPGDIEDLAGSFALHLRAESKQPATITSCLDALTLVDLFLARHGMPRVVANIHRGHVEAFMEDQLARLKSASAANRYRSLQAFFNGRWTRTRSRRVR